MEQSKPLGYMLGQSLRVLRNQLAIEFKERNIKLTLDQFVILHLLDMSGELIQQDLANHMQKDKSIIVRQINYLLENQFVFRLTNKADKRKNNLILTKKGLAILNETKEIESEISGKLLMGICANDLTTFQNVLLKIQENGSTEEDFHNCGLSQPK